MKAAPWWSWPMRCGCLAIAADGLASPETGPGPAERSSSSPWRTVHSRLALGAIVVALESAHRPRARWALGDVVITAQAHLRLETRRTFRSIIVAAGAADAVGPAALPMPEQAPIERLSGRGHAPCNRPCQHADNRQVSLHRTRFLVSILLPCPALPCSHRVGRGASSASSRIGAAGVGTGLDGVAGGS